MSTTTSRVVLVKDAPVFGKPMRQPHYLVGRQDPASSADFRPLSVYFGRTSPAQRAAMDKQVFATFNGRLCTEYGADQRTVHAYAMGFFDAIKVGLNGPEFELVMSLAWYVSTEWAYSRVLFNSGCVSYANGYQTAWYQALRANGLGHLIGRRA